MVAHNDLVQFQLIARAFLTVSSCVDFYVKRYTSPCQSVPWLGYDETKRQDIPVIGNKYCVDTSRTQQAEKGTRTTEAANASHTRTWQKSSHHPARSNRHHLQQPVRSNHRRCKVQDSAQQLVFGVPLDQGRPPNGKPPSRGASSLHRLVRNASNNSSVRQHLCALCSYSCACVYLC